MIGFTEWGYMYNIGLHRFFRLGWQSRTDPNVGQVLGAEDVRLRLRAPVVRDPFRFILSSDGCEHCSERQAQRRTLNSRMALILFASSSVKRW